jgi:hypothetical protein
LGGEIFCPFLFVSARKRNKREGENAEFVAKISSIYY